MKIDKMDKTCTLALLSRGYVKHVLGLYKYSQSFHVCNISNDGRVLLKGNLWG